MFNVAVVNKKDIFKYLVSITITLCLVMYVTRYFSSLDQNEKYKFKLDKKISEIMQTNLLICLDEVIPGIKETNHELNNNDEDKIDENKVLGSLLRIELSMFREEQKMAEIHNTVSNKVENAETDIKENQTNEEQNTEVTR